MEVYDFLGVVFESCFGEVASKQELGLKGGRGKAGTYRELQGRWGRLGSLDGSPTLLYERLFDDAFRAGPT